MSTAKKLDIAERSNIHRVLEYRPHIKATYYMLLICAVLWALPPIGYVFYRTLNGNVDQAIQFISLGLICPTLFLVQAYFWLRPIAFTRVDLRADSMTLERNNKKKEINFERVKRIDFSHMSYVGGWFTMTLNGREKYKFTVALEQSESILESLVNINPQVLDLNQFASYRRTAIVTDHSWARTYIKLSQWKAKVLYYFFTSTIASAVVFWADSGVFSKALSLFSSVLLINLCIGFCKWQICEFIFAHQIQKQLMEDPYNTERDMVFEARIAQRASWVHFILFVILVFRLI